MKRPMFTPEELEELRRKAEKLANSLMTGGSPQGFALRDDSV